MTSRLSTSVLNRKKTRSPILNRPRRLRKQFKGVYAAVADGIFSAERGKIINNANVITMGGWITAPFLGTQIVDAWLEMAFTQKMEFKKDFLTNAFQQVQEIEKENFK